LDRAGVRGVLVLIGLLIGLVVAFLAAWPQLVEVPALRKQLAVLVRESAGADLRLEGAVRLELLPRPRVTIERAVIGDRVALGPGSRFIADRIDIDLAIPPLLAGRLEPRGVQFVRPALILSDVDGAATENLLAALVAGPAAKLARIDVVDGSVVLAGATPTTVRSIDLGMTRDSRGAFELGASMAAGGEPVRLQVDGGPLALSEPMPMRVKADIGPEAQPAEVRFAGHVRVSSAGPQAAGRLTVDTTRGPLPTWFGPDPQPVGVLRSRLDADADSITLAELELTLPEGELRGEARLGTGGAQRLEVTLEGTSLTLSPAILRFSGQVLDTIRTERQGSGAIRFNIASLVWGGGQVRRLKAQADWSEDGFNVAELDAILPGQTVLGWRGSGPASPGSPLDGALSVQSGDLRGLLAWLGSDPATLPEGGITTLDLAAHAAIGGDAFSLKDLDARLDASTVTGDVAIEAGARRRVDLDLQVDRINTALYAPWPNFWNLWRSRLEAFDGSVALKVAQVSHDVLRGRELGLRANLEAGRLDLTSLQLADLAGASLDLAGVVDLPLGAWDLRGTFVVAEPGPIQGLLGIEVPFALDRFAPMRLSAASRREAGVSMVDMILSGTNVDASLRGSLEGEPADGPLELSLTAHGAEARDLLEAFGWPAPTAAPAFGPMSAQITLTRDGGPITAQAATTVGTSRLDGEATVSTAETRPRAIGSLRLDSVDTGLAAAFYDTLAIPLGFPPGDPRLWPGAWPRRPISWSWLNALDLQLMLDARRLRRGGVELGDAKVEIELSDGDLGLRNAHLPLAGGLLSGNATLEGRTDHVILGTQLRLEHAGIESLAMASAAGSAVSGRLDLEASLVGEGRSIADIVGTLAGDGRLAMSSADLPDLGLDGLSLDGAFALNGGILTTSRLGLDYPGGRADLDLRLDLLAWVLDATLELGGRQQRFIGPPGRIAAVVDGPAP